MARAWVVQKDVKACLILSSTDQCSKSAFNEQDHIASDVKGDSRCSSVQFNHTWKAASSIATHSIRMRVNENYKNENYKNENYKIASAMRRPVRMDRHAPSDLLLYNG